MKKLVISDIWEQLRSTKNDWVKNISIRINKAQKHFTHDEFLKIQNDI